MILISKNSSAQELYINSPAAANISKGRMELRNTVESFRNFNYFYNSIEVNYGVTGNLSMYNKVDYTFNEGYKFVGSYEQAFRYRFWDIDKKHQHIRFALQSGFRMPFDPVSVSGDNIEYELHPGHVVQFLSGADNLTVPLIDFYATDNFTFKNSLIATGLFDRFSLTAETGYNFNFPKEHFRFGNYWNWGLSAGYLLLPTQYDSYNDVNLNLYFENKAYFFEKNSYHGNKLRYSGGFRYVAGFGVQTIFFSSLLLEAMYVIPVHSNEYIKDDTRSLLLSVRYQFFL